MPLRLLSTLLLFLALVSPAVAQERADAPAKAREVLRAEEAEMQAAAARWAKARGLPRRILQHDGSWVELVAVEDGQPRYLASHNRLSAQLTHTSSLYPDEDLGLALTGRGLRIGIWDGGRVLATHQEFGGRVAFGDLAATDDHATHVAGTLAAAGLRAEAQGMAYEASLVSYDWSDDASEMTDEAADGLLVSNHSYGTVAGWFYGDVEGTGDGWYWLGDPRVSETEDYAFGWYSSEATQFDRVVHANPYLLPVVSAGNDRTEHGPTSGTYRALDRNGHYQTFDVATTPRPADAHPEGYDTVAGAAGAKNVLTVGSAATGPGGTVEAASLFSSFGPTDDGRIKPDLMGIGEAVLSTRSRGPSAYGRKSGTSMSAPNVAGTALLLQQHHRDVLGTFMRAATLKGLLVHTARDLHLPGPDARTGWGLLDAAAAAAVVSEAAVNPIALFEGLLSEGGTFSQTVRRGDGPVRVTLAWTDPPSARLPLSGSQSLDSRVAHLRNDLDLRVVDESTGRFYTPFRLDPARPSAQASVGDNRVDPVEQILIPAPTDGPFRVVVSHKGSLVDGTGQPFSLVVSGLVDDLAPVAVTHVDALAEADGLVVQWRTQTERAPGRFVVERAPVTYRADLTRVVGAFVELGATTADGQPGAPQDYAYRDGRYLAGRFVYRLVFDDGTDRFIVGEVEVNVPAPDAHAVVTNYPNPFRGETRLVVDLATTGPVRAEVYDLLGRRVAVLLDETLPAGRHELPVDATGWAPGVHLVRVQASNVTVTHRMVRLP